MFRTCCVLVIALTLAHADIARSTEPAESVLRMGIFPRRSAEMTQTMFGPLAEALSRALGRKVTLETSNDFATFWRYVAEQRYDIVHYNQYHYVRSHKDFGYQVFAHNVEYGHSRIAGAILVRKDSGIASLADLKGKKIAFGGGRRAMLAYITATYLLRQAGLNQGDYFEEFALNPGKACIATYYHQTAAAGAGDHVLELPGVKEEIDVNEMMYLAVGEKLAHLPWAVSKNTPAEILVKIQNFMTGLNQSEQGRQILATAGLTDLVRATDSDFNPHRQIIKAVLDEDT